MLYMNTNVYKQSSKCDNQKQLKDIPEADIVSTPEGFTDNSPISTMTSTSINKPSAQKSLCLFTNIFEVKKPYYRRVGSAKYKRNAIEFVNKP